VNGSANCCCAKHKEAPATHSATANSIRRPMHRQVGVQIIFGSPALRKAAIVIDVQKKWALCWGGPCRRRTPRRNLDGRRHPSGPHSRRAGRPRCPRGGPCFLLSPASDVRSASIVGARVGLARGAAGASSIPQCRRARRRAERAPCRALPGPLPRGWRTTHVVLSNSLCLYRSPLASPTT
jgi:hypothetical protein